MQILLTLTAFRYISLPCFKGLILQVHYFLCKSAKGRTWMKDTNNFFAHCYKSAFSTKDSWYGSHTKIRQTSNLFVYFLFLRYDNFNRHGSITPSVTVKKTLVMNVGCSGSGLTWDTVPVSLMNTTKKPVRDSRSLEWNCNCNESVIH
jgi:hypothetical protein